MRENGGERPGEEGRGRGEGERGREEGRGRGEGERGGGEGRETRGGRHLGSSAIKHVPYLMVRPWERAGEEGRS